MYFNLVLVQSVVLCIRVILWYSGKSGVHRKVIC